PRERRQADEGHAPSLPEPARPHRRRHTARDGRLVRRQPLRDLDPEPPLELTTQPRPARRTQLRPTRLSRTPTLRSSHSTPPGSRCCDDRLSPPWLPASEWWITPSPTKVGLVLRRTLTACSKVLVTSAAPMLALTVKPRMRR